MERQCVRCKLNFELTTENFHKRSQNKEGFAIYCRSCVKIKNQECRPAKIAYEDRNREKLRLARKTRYKKMSYEKLQKKRAAWKEKNPLYRKSYYNENRLAALENGRKHHLSRKYGLTEEKYNEAREKQKYRCWICGNHENTFPRGKYEKLVIDHDHKTKELRGLLCDACNNMLGRARDNVNTLRRAIMYLENPPGIPIRDTIYGNFDEQYLHWVSSLTDDEIEILLEYVKKEK